MFFKCFASKNQLLCFYISGTLVENGLMNNINFIGETVAAHRKRKLIQKNCISKLASISSTLLLTFSKLEFIANAPIFYQL